MGCKPPVGQSGAVIVDISPIVPCTNISPNCGVNLHLCHTPFVQQRCQQACGICATGKPGQCPAIRPQCPPSSRQNGQAPNGCTSDAQCAGSDKCCYDTCLTHHTCKPPVGQSGAVIVDISPIVPCTNISPNCGVNLHLCHTPFVQQRCQQACGICATGKPGKCPAI